MPRLKADHDLVGSTQASRILGLHRSTFDSWRRRDVFKPSAVVQGPRGPRYLFSLEDLEEFRSLIDYDA